MPNTQAIFYEKSFCDPDDSGFSLTSNLDNPGYINDEIKTNFAESLGDATDGNEFYILVDFGTERELDTIFLKSNFKTFTVWYWEEEATGSTGGGDYYAAATYTTNALEMLCIKLADPIVTDKIKITVTHTIEANETKQAYFLAISKEVCRLSLEKIDISQDYKKTNATNLYGGSVQVVKYANHPKVSIDLDFENLVGTQYTAYQAVKNQAKLDSFLAYFYFSDEFDLLNAEAVYHVNDIEDFQSSPSSEAMTSGIKGKLKLREV